MASQITGYIGQIDPGNGINYSIGSTVYGECNTAAATAAKTVDMTGFTLIKGATIYVKFINANTASSPTLNIQGTGAKPIIQNNFTTMYWPANTLIGLTYDGTNWVTNDLIDYNNFLQIKPKGGYYNNNKISENSIDVGAIKITLPVPANSNNNAMLNFQVVIYHYNSKDYVTYYISGYPFENTWHPDRCNAYSISNVINSRTNATVRYGNDGTNLCITIGEENTSWKWSQIYITNVYVGYTNITQEKYKNYMDGNWNISFSSTDPVLSTIDYTIENPNILTSITNAINNLDVSNISGFGKGRTLSALSETNGKISATFQDIEISKSQISDFPTSMPASNVYDWAKATNKPSYSLSEITSASDVQAIEALTGTSGFLKKTAANKWELDTTTYVTSSGVTSITLKAGTGISLDTDNTAITTSGTRTISLADNYGDTKNPYSTKNRNLVLASSIDTDGVSPSFRKLVAADLPDMYWANIKISSSSSTSKSPAVANLYIYNNEKQYARFCVSQAGTTTTNGRALLILGNNVASETDGNAHGRIKFYGYGTNNTNLQAQAINSDEKIVYLPDYNGNMYLIHAANNDAVGSNYQPIYADSYGRIKSINYTIQTSVPQNALFTDEKVKQTPVSNYNGNLQVLLSTTAIEETTDKVYKNVNLQYNPSTNKLSTNNLDLSGTLNVTGVTTLSNNVTINAPLTTNSLIVNGNSQFNNNVNFNSLPTIGNQTLLSALGLSNALHFIGIATTAITDGGTENPNISTYDFNNNRQKGDVVLYNNLEYIWTNSNKWEQLGDDRSFALNSISITGTDGLTGGGNLTTNRSISHYTPSGASATTYNNNGSNRTYIKTITTDKFGHITSITTDSETVINTNYYPTAFSWTNGSTEGPTGLLTIEGSNNVSFGAIPTASKTQSGIITTGNQTFKGIKTFYNEGTTSEDVAAGIYFSNKDTETNETDNALIYAYSPHGTGGGANLVVSSKGNLIIGSGEAATQFYNNVAKLQFNGDTEVIGTWGNSGERLYLLSDSVIFLEANAGANSNDVSNRKGVLIDTSGNLIPVAQETTNNNQQNLGSSTSRWKNLYLAGTAEINTLTLGNALSIANGGTGAISFTSGQVLIGNGTSAITTKAIAPSVNLTAGTGTDAPKLKIIVLGQTSTTVELTKASTTVYGVTKLSSDTDSNATDVAATPAAVNAARQANAYAGSIQTTSAAIYNTEPEVKSVKINGSTTSATTSTTNVQLVFDASLKVLNFVFS